MVAGRHGEALFEFLEHAVAVPTEAARAYTRAAQALGLCGMRDGPIRDRLRAYLPADQLRDASDEMTAAFRAAFDAMGDEPPADAFWDPSSAIIELYRRALAATPDYFLALRGLALCLPPENPERLRLLQRAVQQRLDPLAVVALGGHYENGGQPEKARRLYEQAAIEHPNDMDIQIALQRVPSSKGQP